MLPLDAASRLHLARHFIHDDEDVSFSLDIKPRDHEREVDDLGKLSRLAMDLERQVLAVQGRPVSATSRTSGTTESATSGHTSAYRRPNIRLSGAIP
jgi:hypothetical protein